MTNPPLRDLFLLDPSVIFLNHGSFGATPRPVFEAYQRWQLELEKQPVDFLGRRATDLLQSAREDLARYLGTQASNLVFVTNATTGLNIIAHSLDLHSGDEVLTTDHEYGSMDVMWRFMAEKKGFCYINHRLQLPIKDAACLINDFWQGVTERTRVIYISHITSPTAIILPIEEICRRARQAGIVTVVDGAHAPGQIPLALDSLGADFYSGNLHKWLCAPKGSGFLYARPEVHHLVEPLIVTYSWEQARNAPDRFVNVLQYNGTRDLAAFLAVPDAIRFQQEYAWDKVRAYCHGLAAETRHRMVEQAGLPAYYPDSPEWYAQMGTAPLPAQVDVTALRTYLYSQHRVEVPVIEWNGHKHIRFSFQGYNGPDDVDALTNGIDQYLDSLSPI